MVDSCPPRGRRDGPGSQIVDSWEKNDSAWFRDDAAWFRHYKCQKWSFQTIYNDLIKKFLKFHKKFTVIALSKVGCRICEKSPKRSTAKGKGRKALPANYPSKTRFWKSRTGNFPTRSDSHRSHVWCSWTLPQPETMSPGVVHGGCVLNAQGLLECSGTSHATPV